MKFVKPDFISLAYPPAAHPPSLPGLPLDCAQVMAALSLTDDSHMRPSEYSKAQVARYCGAVTRLEMCFKRHGSCLTQLKSCTKVFSPTHSSPPTPLASLVASFSLSPSLAPSLSLSFPPPPPIFPSDFRLKKFNSAFSDLCQRQRRWQISNDELRKRTTAKWGTALRERYRKALLRNW